MQLQQNLLPVVCWFFYYFCHSGCNNMSSTYVLVKNAIMCIGFFSNNLNLNLQESSLMCEMHTVHVNEEAVLLVASNCIIMTRKLIE